MTSRADRFFRLGLALVVAAFLLWQLNHLGGYRWDWDEGVYLTTARAVADGQALYRDIFSAAPPLFINSINAAFAVAGQSTAAARGAVALYGALGVLAVGLIGRELGGRVAGISAAVLLAVTPHFYMLSRAIIADVPAVSLGCLALWMAIRYERTGRRPWLAGAGVLMALGACIKLSAGLVGPAIILAILLRDLRGEKGAGIKSTLVSLLILGAGFVGPVIVYALAYPSRLIYEQMIVLLATQGRTYGLDLRANLDLMVSYLVIVNRYVMTNRSLTILAIAGVVALIARSRKNALLYGTWLVVVLAVLVNYSPLWVHLLSPLLFPLAVAAGIALGELWQLLGLIRQEKRLLAAALLGLLVAATGYYLYQLPVVIAQDRRFAAAPSGSQEKSAVKFVEKNTRAGEYLVTDDPMIAFAANRNIPPNLADCSQVRIATGYLKTEEVISATQRYEPAAVVLAR